MSADLTVGIDIGGTKISGVLMDGISVTGEILSIETPKSEPAGIMDAVISLIQRIKKPGTSAIGISTGGNVNYITGEIISATDTIPHWKGTQIRQIISDAFSLPVFVENDGSMAVYGEWKTMAFQKITNVIGITIGTGLGAGIIYDSKLIQNPEGLQANLHSIPAPDLFNCGERNYEYYLSGRGIINIAEAVCKPNPFQYPHEVPIAYNRHDIAAENVMNGYFKYLSLLIKTVSKIIPPECFIIGGGVAAKNKNIFLTETEKIQSMFSFPLKISELNNNAGAIGAALYADDMSKS